MKLTKRTAICILGLLLGGCASSASVHQEAFFKDIKKSPLRPWYTRQTMPGDPDGYQEYYGIQVRVGL